MSEDLTTRLPGEVITLEPISPAHEDALWKSLDFDEVWNWIPIGRIDRDSFGEFFRFLLAENEAGRMGTFINRSNESGEVIGTSSYLAIRPEHRGLEIGYTMVCPAAWKTGANIEAKLLMIGHAIDDLGFQRVEFKTDSRNERSRAALAALPAQFEGIFRSHMDTRDTGVRDSAYYSVIAAEWPDVRENLKRRLAGPRA